MTKLLSEFGRLHSRYLGDTFGRNVLSWERLLVTYDQHMHRWTSWMRAMRGAIAKADHGRAYHLVAAARADEHLARYVDRNACVLRLAERGTWPLQYS